jgi:hypothetical protein
MPLGLPAHNRENLSLGDVNLNNALPAVKLGDISMAIAGFIAADGMSALTLKSTWFSTKPSTGSAMPFLDAITTLTNVFASISAVP